MIETFALLLLIGLAIYFIWNQCTCCKDYFTTYQDIPSKCFSCERELPPDWKWLGQPAKCFDCQYDHLQRYGPGSVYAATQQKTFSL